jgi:hypothetical protein
MGTVSPQPTLSAFTCSLLAVDSWDAESGAWNVQVDSADEAQVAAIALQSIALPGAPGIMLAGTLQQAVSGSPLSEAEARLSCRGSSDLGLVSS